MVKKLKRALFWLAIVLITATMTVLLCMAALQCKRNGGRWVCMGVKPMICGCSP